MTEITDAGISDGELNEMHARLAREPAGFSCRRDRQRLLAYVEYLRTQVIPRITREWEREKDRADKHEAAIARVRELHWVHDCLGDGHLTTDEGPCVVDGSCNECGWPTHPCPTLRALDQHDPRGRDT